MQMNIKNMFFLFLFLVNASCTSDEESRRQENSSFQGSWTGSFSGEESGTINFSVEKQGTIIGTLATSNNSISENFEGYVSFDGKFDINTRNKYYFSGFLDNVKPINGQWKRYSDLGEKNGTFILTKN